MQKKYSEFGRTLLETLAVLVVIAILLLSSLVGYNFVVDKYKKDQTVKSISELSVRYKVHPITKKGPREIKAIYPEAERADAVTMKTADTDTGRVQLVVSEDTSYFSVLVNNILDDSCEAVLERGEYDAALVTGASGYDENSEYVILGQNFLKDFNYNDLSSEQKKLLEKAGINSEKHSKQDVIDAICTGGNVKSAGMNGKAVCKVEQE